MPDQVDDDLSAMADRVRCTYWAARANFELAGTGRVHSTGPRPVPRWDGGQDNDGRKHKPIWPRIARRFLDAGVSPESAVRALFDGRAGVVAPQPNQLLTFDMAKVIEGQEVRRSETIRRQIEAERHAFRREAGFIERTSSWDSRTVLRLVLTSPSIDLSPLFRFCVAVSAKQEDLAGDCREAAFAQYVSYPRQYDVELGEYIPSEFKERASGLKNLARL